MGDTLSFIIRRHGLLPCISLALAALCLAMVEGTQYTVGGSSGWNLGVDYNTWASTINFKIGDTLVFNYGGIHSVLQVSEEDYKSCNTANAISSGTGGKTTVKLEEEQTYYFICGAAGHCSNGMQLSVTVHGGSSSPSNGAIAPPASKTPPSTDTSWSTSLGTSLLSWQTIPTLSILFISFYYWVPELI